MLFPFLCSGPENPTLMKFRGFFCKNNIKEILLWKERFNIQLNVLAFKVSPCTPWCIGCRCHSRSRCLREYVLQSLLFREGNARLEPFLQSHIFLFYSSCKTSLDLRFLPLTPLHGLPHRRVGPENICTVIPAMEQRLRFSINVRHLSYFCGESSGASG